MFALTFLGDVIVFVVGVFGGGFLDYKYRDKVLAWYQGAETFAKNLEAKASAVRSAVTKA